MYSLHLRDLYGKTVVKWKWRWPLSHRDRQLLLCITIRHFLNDCMNFSFTFHDPSVLPCMYLLSTDYTRYLVVLPHWSTVPHTTITQVPHPVTLSSFVLEAISFKWKSQNLGSTIRFDKVCWKSNKVETLWLKSHHFIDFLSPLPTTSAMIKVMFS